MTEEGGNLFTGIAPDAGAETFLDLVSAPGIRIERIVSSGQHSPPDFWYDQPWAEWVLVITGNAVVEFDDEAEPRSLVAGDYLYIAAGRRHRVNWTDTGQATVWLAVHIGEPLTA